ncbi:DUF1538 domain-containing protein [Bacillus solitudinis]|uniref:DUF1538 domain-containing protein n=1 Tax=Bacillus solitudinis TaxID=2014074 RepID=UPI000C230475|nr:DUF1538 domain-containing protein [Bacillus solitudinis]
MQRVKDTVKEVVYAIIPLSAVIIILQFTVIGLKMDILIQFITGVIMVSVGLILFLLGVHIGLLPVGDMIGTALPKMGKAWLIILIGFILGFVVTVAEPDVRVLATQIDEVSKGIVSENMLIYSVALGVALFVGLAMLRILLEIPITYLLVCGYGLVFLLAAFTPSHFIPISFDAGGVTTGPMTVPFILALGVGVASVLREKSGSTEGFGLVALASIGPILAVLVLGVIYG